MGYLCWCTVRKNPWTRLLVPPSSWRSEQIGRWFPIPLDTCTVPSFSTRCWSSSIGELSSYVCRQCHLHVLPWPFQVSAFGWIFAPEETLKSKIFRWANLEITRRRSSFSDSSVEVLTISNSSVARSPASSTSPPSDFVGESWISEVDSSIFNSPECSIGSSYAGLDTPDLSGFSILRLA